MTPRTLPALALAITASLLLARAPGIAAEPFDQSYSAYRALLTEVVHPPRVDYGALKAAREPLDRVVASLAAPPAETERSWTRAQRMAFWINAYNVLTLRAIVDHYPIRAGWLTLAARRASRHWWPNGAAPAHRPSCSVAAAVS